MHLTILTADLLPPLRFAPPVATSNLDALLRRATVTTTAGAALEEAVLAAFHSTDGAASITARVDMPTERGTWLRADPVHLAVSRDNIQLFDSHVVKPTADEMAEIAATLNQHFAQDGLAFLFPDAARGYVRVEPDDIPETTPLWKMGGANVFEHLPRQQQCRTNWRRVGNEIQMLLHDHPVNSARESRQQYPINGLWIWGGGFENASNNKVASTTPSFPRCDVTSRESKFVLNDPLVEQNLDSRLRGNDGVVTISPHINNTKVDVAYQHVIGRLALARGLADLHGISCAPLPEKLTLPTIDNTLIALHAPTREIRAASPYQWQLELQKLDNDWIAPALAAFDAKLLSSLTLIVANEATTLTIQAKRPSLLSRIFPNKKSLTDYA